jgi:hypothetical protein
VEAKIRNPTTKSWASNIAKRGGISMPKRGITYLGGLFAVGEKTVRQEFM